MIPTIVNIQILKTLNERFQHERRRSFMKYSQREHVYDLSLF